MPHIQDCCKWHSRNTSPTSGIAQFSRDKKLPTVGDKVVSENDIVEKEIYIEAIGAQEHRQGLGFIIKQYSF